MFRLLLTLWRQHQELRRVRQEQARIARRRAELATLRALVESVAGRPLASPPPGGDYRG